jgi:hypothetical protein
MSNKFVVPLTAEAVTERFKEMGVPIPEGPPVSPATMERIDRFLQGELLTVHHTPPCGAWMRTRKTSLSYFEPIDYK